MQQALKMYQADNNVDFDEIETNLTGEKFMQTYILPYVQIIGECKGTAKCYRKPPLAIDRKTKLVIGNKFYILKDGAFLGINLNSTSGKVFYIDINGAKEPNYAGRDIFFFYYVNKKTILDDKVHPECDSGVSSLKSGLYPGAYSACYLPFTRFSRAQLLGSSIDRSCSRNALKLAVVGGDACAALIMLDGWKIEKDYPW